MRYDLIEKVEDLSFEYDKINLERLKEQIDGDEYNGDVLHYIDDLIEEYLWNIETTQDLQQYLVYLDNKMRYFTIPCKHYALEKLFEAFYVSKQKGY